MIIKIDSGETNKKFLLMKYCIIHNHIDFRKDPNAQQLGLAKPHIFCPEYLVEDVIVDLGGFGQRSNTGYLEDLPNGDDVKTATIKKSPALADRVICNTHQAYITGVFKGEKEKNGALRTIYANPHYERCEFVYVPKKLWVGMYNCKGTIKALYNKLNDEFPTWECKTARKLGCRRFSTIKELAEYRA